MSFFRVGWSNFALPRFAKGSLMRNNGFMKCSRFHLAVTAANASLPYSLAYCVTLKVQGWRDESNYNAGGRDQQ